MLQLLLKFISGFHPFHFWKCLASSADPEPSRLQVLRRVSILLWRRESHFLQSSCPQCGLNFELSMLGQFHCCAKEASWKQICPISLVLLALRLGHCSTHPYCMQAHLMCICISEQACACMAPYRQGSKLMRQQGQIYARSHFLMSIGVCWCLVGFPKNVPCILLLAIVDDTLSRVAVSCPIMLGLCVAFYTQPPCN